jgi:hypothetical protein
MASLQRAIRAAARRAAPLARPAPRAARDAWDAAPLWLPASRRLSSQAAAAAPVVAEEDKVRLLRVESGSSLAIVALR